ERFCRSGSDQGTLITFQDEVLILSKSALSDYDIDICGHLALDWAVKASGSQSETRLRKGIILSSRYSARQAVDIAKLINQWPVGPIKCVRLNESLPSIIFANLIASRNGRVK